VRTFPHYTVDNLPEGLDEGVRVEAVDLIGDRDLPGAGDFLFGEFCEFANCGSSKGRALLQTKEVTGYQDGGRWIVTRKSAFNRRIALLIAANLPGQPRPKIREVKTAFKRKLRVRTPQELAALDRANLARHEAKLRRLEEEAKTASGI
jgi:hypothetical protein